MTRTEIRSFHAVAQYGGFSAAARALHISQSALSVQIKSLEQSYGVDLFNRTTRRVTLTIAGAELFNITTRLFQIEDEATDLLNSFKGLHSGCLRIAAVGPFHATDIIVAYKSRYPNIEIIVQFGNSRRSFERVLNYEADVALIAEVNPDVRVETIAYSTHDVVVFVNADHPFFDRPGISISELQGQRVILREQGSTTRMAIEKALAASGITVETVLDLGSREGIWKAVEQGLGIGFVADFEFVPHPNLRAIPIIDTDICTRYFLAFLRERREARIIKSFMDVAIKKLEAS